MNRKSGSDCSTTHGGNSPWAARAKMRRYASVMIMEVPFTGAETNCPGSALPIHVVRRVVAPEAALERRVRIRLALLGDLLGVRRIAREFEEHPVGICDIDRAAIAVLQHKGVGRRIARRLEALLDLVLRRWIDLERDVMKGRLRDWRAKRPLVILIGELKERQRAAVGEAEEAVAIRAHLPEQFVGFAPGRHQRQPNDLLVELTGLFHILGGIGGMMQ